jgi:hypothetical protein
MLMQQFSGERLHLPAGRFIDIITEPTTRRRQAAQIRVIHGDSCCARVRDSPGVSGCVWCVDAREIVKFLSSFFIFWGLSLTLAET